MGQRTIKIEKLEYSVLHYCEFLHCNNAGYTASYQQKNEKNYGNLLEKMKKNDMLAKKIKKSRDVKIFSQNQVKTKSKKMSSRPQMPNFPRKIK